MKNNLKTINNYLNIGFILTYITLLPYIFFIKDINTLPLSLYYLFTTPIYYYLALGLILVILSPILRYLSFLIVLVKTLFDTLLLINFIVFKSYSFHIDSLFIDMLLHDLGGLGISTFAYIFSFALFFILFAINFYLLKKVKEKKGSTLKVTTIMISLFIGNQLIHIWASYFNQEYITKYTPYFPHYLPTTSISKMKKLSESYPILIPKKIGKKDNIEISHSNQDMFHYPKKPIIFNKEQIKKPNILFVVLESWQGDKLNKNTTPHLYNFATQNQNYLNHFSSGNVTLTGLFGLMYGLYATANLKAVSSNPLKYQTILTKSLEKLNYNIDLYSSSNLYRFSFKDMFFGDINSSNVHIIKSEESSKNDKKVINALLNDLSTNNKKPWFKFLFLTSSHHSYYYPKRFEKNLPITDNAEAFLLNSNIDPTPYKNRYKNSLLFEDDLVNSVLKKLNSKVDDTIIIITGDHAEEFNESGKGFWGHGSSFGIYQTHVPLIIHLPHNKAKVVKDRSYHIDIVPTVLKYMGVENSVSDFSNGVDLQKLNKQNRNMIFASYKDRAYLMGDNLISVGLFTKRYKLKSYEEDNVTIDMNKIRELKRKENSFFYDINENKRFLK